MLPPDPLMPLADPPKKIAPDVIPTAKNESDILNKVVQVRMFEMPPLASALTIRKITVAT